MKIITKTVEYYDHLTGIYGVDPLLVYDRRKTEGRTFKVMSGDYLAPFLLSINGRFRQFFYYKDRCYHTPSEVIELYKLISDFGRRDLGRHFWNYNRVISGEYLGHSRDGLISDDSISFLVNHWNNRDAKNEGMINVNIIHSQPVIANTGWGIWNLETMNKSHSWFVPNLIEWDIPHYIPAQEMYLEVIEFLGWLNDNPPIPNNQTDKEKVVGHGFDVKTSFRPKMKNTK